jgi:branched-chain amino acid transport system substrate-binding protein
LRKTVVAVALGALTLVAVGCASSKPSAGTNGSSSTSAPAATSGTSSGGGNPATGTPIPIGTVGSYTGPQAASLGQTGKVVSAWADWVNAHGGINNHPVKLFNGDDASDPAKSLSIVQGFVQNDHVVAIVAENSDVDGSWASYVAAQKIPVIGSAIFNFAYQTNPYFFPPGTTTVAANYATLAAAKKLGKTHFGLLYCAEAAACAQAVPLFQAVAPEAGLTLSYSGKVSAFSTDFTAQCLAAKSAGVDVMESATDATTATRVAASCAKQGYHPAWVGQDGTVTLQWQKTPALNGALTAQPVFPYADTSVQSERDFQAALQQYAPGILGSSSFSENDAEDWAGGQLFVAAAKAANLGDNPSAAQVLQGLYSLHNETLGGITVPLSFVSGQPTHINCWFYMGVENGSFTTPSGLTPDCVPAGVKLPG